MVTFVVDASKTNGLGVNLRPEAKESSHGSVNCAVGTVLQQIGPDAAASGTGANMHHVRAAENAVPSACHNAEGWVPDKYLAK